MINSQKHTPKLQQNTLKKIMTMMSEEENLVSFVAALSTMKIRELCVHKTKA